MSADSAMGADGSEHGDAGGEDLFDRDVAVAAAHRARRGRERALWEVGIPRTFRLPTEEWAWRSEAARTPATGWVLRPASSAPDVADVAIDVEDHLVRNPHWVIQENPPAVMRVDGVPCRARLVARVDSLDPLTASVVDGPLRCTRVDPGSAEPYAVLAPAPPDAIAWRAVPTEWAIDQASLRRAMHRLAADLLLGGRETLVRALRDVPAPAPGEASDRLALTVEVILDGDGHPWLRGATVEPHPGTWPPGPCTPVSWGSPPALSRLTEPTDVAPAAVEAVPETVLETVLEAVPETVLEAVLEAPLVVSCGVRTWALDDDTVVRAATGEIHILRGLPSYLWAAALDGLAPAEIAAELRGEGVVPDHFDIEGATRNQLGLWVEAGLLTRHGRTDAATSACPPIVDPTPTPRVAWNAVRLYTLGGRSVSVRAPTDAIAAWVDRALTGLAVPGRTPESAAPITADPELIWAFSEIEPRPGGWRIVGQHHPALPCASTLQLPLLARQSVLAGLTAAIEDPTVEASVLATDTGAVVVLGLVGFRLGVVLAWLADGGQMLCEGLAVMGERVAPARTGVDAHAAEQWFEEPPTWGQPDSPLIDRDGWIRQVWFTPTTALAPEPLPVSTIVVLTDPDTDTAQPPPIGAADALQALLDACWTPTAPLSGNQVERLVDTAQASELATMPATPATDVVAWIRARTRR